jgi:hypothetical protein
LHNDGKRWQEQTERGIYRLLKVWGSGPKDVYAVGGNIVMHYDGSSWRTILSQFRCGLVDISGTGPQHIFVLSLCGDVLFYDGKSWVSLPSPTTNELHRLWVSPRGELFVAGDGGAMLRLELEGRP